MHFGSLTRFAWVSKSRKSIFINVDSASVFWGYKIVELGVLIPSQVFCYVDLPRQYDNDVSVLKVIRIRNEIARVFAKSHTYRLLIKYF